MPFVDLSGGVPAGARWIKLRYSMTASQPDEPLVAKVWSGNPTSAVLLKGGSGEALVKLEVPQTLSYERADAVNLSLKVVAYKVDD